ncbi:MAG: hypothetical protein NZ772_03495 [Cyanobacteria bacterium]|nr:hypothetical protein [Cyanobacteriota bacterium]MDW8199704.1 hypothetical protein [Cyanobacteriota bacterium SKYGB_h_bin112]
MVAPWTDLAIAKLYVADSSLFHLCSYQSGHFKYTDGSYESRQSEVIETSSHLYFISRS